jgi:hypothetical protein
MARVALSVCFSTFVPLHIKTSLHLNNASKLLFMETSRPFDARTDASDICVATQLNSGCSRSLFAARNGSTAAEKASKEKSFNNKNPT